MTGPSGFIRVTRRSTEPGTPRSPHTSSLAPVTLPPGLARPRRASEIIDLTIQLLRQHYAQFVTLTVIFGLPILVLRLTMLNQLSSSNFAALGAILTHKSLTSSPTGPTNAMAVLAAVALIALLGIMEMSVIIVAASDSYLGRPIDIMSVLRRALSNFFTVIIAVFLKSVIIGLSVLVFVVGMAITYSLFFAVPATALLEDNNAIDALARSNELATDLKWHIFVTLGLIGVIYLLVSLVPLAIGAGLALLLHSSKWATLCTSLGEILTQPVLFIAVVVLYYDTRVRKESFGIAAAA